jgi:hypothetical protein
MLAMLMMLLFHFVVIIDSSFVPASSQLQRDRTVSSYVRQNTLLLYGMEERGLRCCSQIVVSTMARGDLMDDSHGAVEENLVLFSGLLYARFYCARRYST